MRFSLLSDFLMLNRTGITISKFSDQLSADLFIIIMFFQVPCLQHEFKSDQECVSVKGRLSRALEFWKDIHAPQFILGVLNLVINCHYSKSALVTQPWLMRLLIAFPTKADLE